MKTHVGPKVSLLGLKGVWPRRARGAGGGSHVCGKPCKQRFKMIKCFRSRSCVGSVLSSRLSGLVFRGFPWFGWLAGWLVAFRATRWPCKVSFSKNPLKNHPPHGHLFGSGCAKNAATKSGIFRLLLFPFGRKKFNFHMFCVLWQLLQVSADVQVLK